ncbi:hemolysin family protein [Methylocella sp. CPCC 101449]|uniref:hemolysin family protein n=1 Tax=Methylocella sp. CPCC 101449 TaxID=2987531 RepID=UPI00288E3B16|nr:hemolysin family protein [Methylocella sp. CPCC 101449]MDT2024466.1 hemolysin family protein [Methylocella sp. CPCC 101449]HEV2571032.1 hemolysin family protein [Beijerinckiaceae bacterium]
MFELIIAVGLIALNALFSLSEFAIVSARKTRLKTLADIGRSGASLALELAENPGRFLSTVQIGITLVGILAGAFSGAALGAEATFWLRQHGVWDGLVEPLGYGLVIGTITYLSVVVGELVPKQIALRNAEGIACTMAPVMYGLSKLAAPLVYLLDVSTRAIFKVFGVTELQETAPTEEEIKTLVEEAADAGVIESDEQRMITGVLRLGDRHVSAVMTPRTDVEWLDLELDDDEIRTVLANTKHSRLPVGEGSPDRMIGVLQVRELLAPMLTGAAFDPRAHVRKAPEFPDVLDALDALQALRQAEVPMALVHDEHGHFDGIVTPADILDAIAGAFRSDEGSNDPEAVLREDGSWLLAGWMPADEAAELLHIGLPERREYETVAGLIISALQRLPTTGEFVEAHGWRFEVVDLDGRRVDKILAAKLPDPSEQEDG